MKSIIILVIFCIFCSILNFGCSKDNSPGIITKSLNFKDTKKINTVVSNNLNAVSFLDSKTGYIVGDSGLILKTTDEGETWEKLNSGVKSTLFCLTVSDANILIGGNELILKSSDNGNTWLRKDTIYSDIYAILKISEDIGIAVGGFFSTNAFIEAIYITNNNGYTWVKQKLNFRTGLIRSVLKLNDNSLIIASSDCIDLGQLCDVGIYKSTGNYSNYKQIYNLKGYGFHSLVSPDGTSIIAVGYEGRIIYSSDAGENWIDRKSSYNNPLRSVAYYSKDNYYAVGDSGIIISTSDNGQNYTKLNSNTSNKLRSICFPSQYYGIAVGANGTIIKMLFE